MVIYDASNHQSFQNAIAYIKNIEELGPEKAHKCLIANKVDIERQVSTEEGQAFAHELGLDYYEVSAKDGSNIAKAFEESIYKAYLKNKEWFVKKVIN